MNAKSFRYMLSSLSIATLIGGGWAIAQDPPAETKESAATKAVSATAQLEEGKSVLTKMDSNRQILRKQLETARTQKDVVKLLCLGDKLNQFDVTIKSAEERIQSLEIAAKQNDSEMASHESTILSVLKQRTEQLSGEASMCIGQETSTVEEETKTKVDVDQKEAGPENFLDVTSAVTPVGSPMSPTVLSFAYEPPICASCYN